MKDHMYRVVAGCVQPDCGKLHLLTKVDISTLSEGGPLWVRFSLSFRSLWPVRAINCDSKTETLH